MGEGIKKRELMKNGEYELWIVFWFFDIEVCLFQRTCESDA
jgi:hypothetical protein